MIQAYNIISLACFILLIPYFLYRIIVKGKYINSIRYRFLPPDKSLIPEKKPRIWIHAVSVGEVEAAQPIVRKIHERYPDIGLIVSTVTETGQNVARKKVESADLVCYFPLDLPVVVPSFFKRVEPDLVLLTETEIWPYFINVARKKSVPVILINGRISKKSFRRYMLFRFFLKRVLAEFDMFLMQGSADVERIIEMGAPPDRVVNVGNIKFDQVLHAKDMVDSAAVRKRFHIPGDLDVIVAGSTHPGEEKIFIEAVLTLQKEGHSNIFPVIAPRHVDRIGEIETLLEEYGTRWIKRSEYDTNQQAPSGNDDPSIPLFFILDTIGELALFYSAATIVFIGGSFVPIGGHNILEPAVFGVPVCFGPHMGNFAEIRTMFLEANAGEELHNQEELVEFFDKLLKNPEERISMGKNGLRVVEKKSGATIRTIEILDPWIMKKQE